MLIPAELNEGQKEAYSRIVSFLESKTPEMYLLEGYAGTGKTYLIGKIIKYILDKHQSYTIAITAPTNKAVKVLQKTSGIKNSRIEFQTVHKLLGLKEEITQDGKQVFKKAWDSAASIEEFDVLIIDEVSMLEDQLFIEIEGYKRNLRIIMMGDPAQIPPVNKPDSIPFLEGKAEQYSINKYRLEEIMRQTVGNPIIESSFILRNNLNERIHTIPRESQLTENGNGIIFLDANIQTNRDLFTDYLKEYFVSDNFNANPDYAKVIAWRNATVNNVNTLIRKMIYGANPGKIMVNEKLLANKPIIDETLDMIIFSTNEEFEVASYNIESRTVPTDGAHVILSYYDTTVIYEDITGKKLRKTINILHEDSEKEFEHALNLFKRTALSLKGYEAKKAWVKYYKFARRFADVNYNYGITGHKAQGSTYRNVFILEDDLDYNKNIYERNRIKYTSYTRPSDKLFILKR